MRTGDVFAEALRAGDAAAVQERVSEDSTSMRTPI